MFNNNQQAAAKDFNSAKSDAKKTKNEAIDAAYEVKDGLQNAAQDAGHKVRKIYDHARDDFRHAADNVTYQIRSKPVQSAAIAAGVGFLVGLLVRRV